ncbi:MAG: N-succinylarginine dihydrolase, partial [Lamprocystis purpurea]|nr:N-succinylarginine dihydrolase [Lamprocystis purpurea]
SLQQLRHAMEGVGAQLNAIRVDTAQVSVADAVASYLFNSQLLSKDNGKMALVIPQECQENAAVAAYLQGLVGTGRVAVEQPLSRVAGERFR